MSIKSFTTSVFLVGCLGILRPGLSSTVDVVKVDDHIINPVTARYIINAITDAESALHECIIIELDTPGGLLEATRDLVKKELGARIPVVVYIAPSGSRAASAGVFITLAGHIAAMAPGTNIGAAHPVTPGGEKNECGRMFEIAREKKEGEKESREGGGAGAEEKKEEKPKEPEDVMSEKILSDTAAWIRAIASYRGRNAAWAVSAVRESVSATAEEAVSEHVVDMVCGSIDELLEKIDGREVRTAAGPKKLDTRGATIKTIDMNTRQRVLSAISNPQIAYILFMLGIIGLFIEFRTPGIGFPGIAGAICLLLALFAFQTLPVNYAGVLLILLAIALFAAEVKVVSYGLLTVGGLICMVLGSLMLIESQEAFMGVSLNLVIPVAGAIAIIVIFLMTIVVKAQMRKSTTGMDGIIGTVGVADSRIDPNGTIVIHGEIWSAMSRDVIEKGERVRVIGAEGLKLFVVIEKGSAVFPGAENESAR